MPPAAADLRDIKPLMALSYGVPTLVVVLVLAAAVALALGWLWRWWRKRRPVKGEAGPVVAAEAPELRAHRELTRLHDAVSAMSLARQRYFFGISEVLRTYVEARFAFNATDLTTYEIHQQLGHTGVPAEPGAELLALLAQADAIKFARAEATASDCDDVHRRAHAFVDITTPAVVSPAPFPAAAAPTTSTAAPAAAGS
jgi:hypothetical protein